MSYYKVEPEVPAGIGVNSIIEHIPGQPLRIDKLHLEFEGWLGADLMGTSPAFYITERLKSGIEAGSYSGIVGFEPIEVSKSDNFRELYPDKELPNLYLLRLDGKSRESDFAVENGILIVSQTAKSLLDSYDMSIGEFEELD